MDYSSFSGRNSWLQTEQPLHNQDERSPQRNEAVGEVMLGANEDVSGGSPTLANALNPQSFYTIPPQYFTPYTYTPLTPYGGQQQTQWISSYSSLNGATSNQSTSQPQRSPVQQIQSPILQHSPPPQQSTSQQQYSPPHMSPLQQHLSIDPSLMNLNSYSQTTHSPTNYVHPGFFYQNHTPTLSLNPSLLHAPPHTPTPPTSSLSTPTQTQLQGQAEASSLSVDVPSVASRTTLVDILNNLLSAKSLPPSEQLIRTIATIGPSGVDLPGRLKVLSKIRDHAGNDFYQSWASNPEGMDIVRDWLRGAVATKSGEWEETLMPLLHVIDRLPLTVESLKNTKLGKVILKLKDWPSSAVRDMASNLENRWRALVAQQAHDKQNDNASKKSEGKSPEDSRAKKRKLEEATPKTAPPAKKLALSKTAVGPAKPVAVKREPVKPSPAVKDAKSDSSFFSAPKPKPKLPSFKKAPIKKEADPNVAQPSAVDPFKDALAAMTKARSSPTPVPGPEAKATPPPTTASLPGKKKKRVVFKSEDKLVEIRLIEPAIYDDDVADGMWSAHNVRDLDRDEGAALHKHIFEEQIDWSEPLLLELPEGLDKPRGEESQEKVTQEEREKSALNALYMPGAQIPESPAEPFQQIPEDEVDTNVKHMLSGNEVRELDRGDQELLNSTSTVGSLISQLGVLGGALSTEPVANTPAATIASIDLKALGLDMDLLAQIAAQAPAQQQQQGGANGYYGQPPPPVSTASSYVGDQAWSNQYQEYGQSYDEEGGQRPRGVGWDSTQSDQGWRGGRGRGGRGGAGGRGSGSYRGSKRKLCNFYAQGRCRYGDQCDFLHES